MGEPQATSDISHVIKLLQDTVHHAHWLPGFILNIDHYDVIGDIKEGSEADVKMATVPTPGGTSPVFAVRIPKKSWPNSVLDRLDLYKVCPLCGTLFTSLSLNKSTAIHTWSGRHTSD